MFGKEYEAINYSKQVQKVDVEIPNRKSVNKVTSGQNEFSSIEIVTMDMNANMFNDYASALVAHFQETSLNISNTEFIITYQLNSGASYSEIKGISSMEISSNHYLDHRLFATENGQATENTSFQVELSDFTIYDIVTLLNYVITPEQSSSPTITIVHKMTPPQSLPQIQRKKMGKELLDGGVAYRPNQNSGGCSCGDTEDCGYGMNDDGTHGERCAGSCLVVSVDNDYTADALDIAGIYTFRDEFLSTTSVGRKYIHYYYFISYVQRQYPNLSELSLEDKFMFIVSCYNVAKTLQQGQSNDVVITTAFKNEATSIIDNYRMLTANESYQNVLDDIEADLARFENLTKAEVIAMLNQ